MAKEFFRRILMQDTPISHYLRVAYSRWFNFWFFIGLAFSGEASCSGWSVEHESEGMWLERALLYRIVEKEKEDD